MTGVRELSVWLCGVETGVLEAGRVGGMTFRYTAEYAAQSLPRALSLSLPVRDTPFTEAETRGYFANLLPDAGLRQAVARKLGISVGNDFALLEAIGGECPGAVTILAPGTKPGGVGRYRRLGEADFQQLIDELPRRPLLAGERGVRLSLAGAQQKLALRYAGGEFLLATGTAATSHIVKPGVADVEAAVRNEAFCMNLAARADVPAPQAWVHRGREPVYVVERFDRRVSAEGVVERLHAEDLCQATGRMPENKYEADGGPGLAECFNLLQEHSTQPATDRKHLLRWAVFNAMVENADAHAKNVSVLHEAGGVRLAPFYDLLSTGVYPGVGEKLAMSLGGEKRPKWLRRRHWERLAEQAQIGQRVVLETVGELAETLPGIAKALAEEQEAVLGPSPVVGKMVQNILARTKTAAGEVESRSLGR